MMLIDVCVRSLFCPQMFGLITKPDTNVRVYSYRTKHTMNKLHQMAIGSDSDSVDERFR